MFHLRKILTLKNNSCLWMLLLLLPLPVLAWDASGHRIIAAIAYQNLTPVVKQRIDAITQASDPGYSPSSRFLYAAVIPDEWRRQQLPDTAVWHYISTTLSADGTSVVVAPSPNVVTALSANITVLQNTAAPLQQRAMALAFVAHLVGDAHQPLHAINRFSQSHPTGDRGGNLFLLQDQQADNLHAFWDQAAHLFSTPGGRYPLGNKAAIRLAQQLQQRYPEKMFRKESTDLNVQHWVEASFTLARDKVYALQENSYPSSQYIKMTREISEQQMVLAGYRLANLLNTLLGRYGVLSLRHLVLLTQNKGSTSAPPLLGVW